VREQYEAKQGGKGPDAKRLTELEGELEQTKLYYQKRIRELEDKYKYGGATSAKDKKDDKKDKKEKKEKKDKKAKKDKDDDKKDKKAIIHNLEDKVQGLEE
jgi:hypothetical protein